MRFRDDAKLDPSQVADIRSFVTPIELGDRDKETKKMAGLLRPPSGYRPSKSRQSVVAAALDEIRRRVEANKVRSGTSSPSIGLTQRFMGDLKNQAFARMAPPAAPLAPVDLVYGGGGGGGVDLSGIGGAPDKAAYLRPFDEAEARTREAHAAAVPAITDAYAQLVERLRGNQGEMAATQSRLAGEQGARLAQGQQQVAQLQAPVLADLGAHFGPDTVGSLQGAVQAEAANQRAALAAQGTAQQSLAAELAAQSARSGETRLADSELGKQAALSTAQVNLNDILGQIGVQRAGAERQYANDLTQWERARAQASGGGGGNPLDAIEQQLDIARKQKDLEGGNIDDELARAIKETTLAKNVRDLKPKELPREVLARQLSKTKMVKAKDLFERILLEAPDKKTAYEGLAAFAAGNEAFGNTDKPGTWGGSRINPTVIRGWIDRWYDDKPR